MEEPFEVEMAVKFRAGVVVQFSVGCAVAAAARARAEMKVVFMMGFPN